MRFGLPLEPRIAFDGPADKKYSYSYDRSPSLDQAREQLGRGRYSDQ
jgi:hypothetical protein